MQFVEQLCTPLMVYYVTVRQIAFYLNLALEILNDFYSLIHLNATLLTQSISALER